MRPYGVVRYDHDAVGVVGHDDERVQFDFGPVGGGTRPFLAGDEGVLVQTDRIAFDGPEQTFAAVGAYRDEIRPARRVIVAAEADGPAVVFAAVERHRPFIVRAQRVAPLLRPAKTSAVCRASAFTPRRRSASLI